MEIRNLYPGAWASNCYLLTVGTHAAVVDPSPNVSSILKALDEAGATLDYILLTHGHFDHITSIDTLRDATGAPLYCHVDDAELLGDAFKNASQRFFSMEMRYRDADRFLQNGDALALGDETVRVISTPGHTKGSVCYLCNYDFLLTGDTLFEESYGRYDLYGGDAKELFTSLRSLRALPQKLWIYPGHGDRERLGTALDNTLY